MVWRMMVTGALVLLLALQAWTNEKITDQDTFAVKAGLIYTLSEGTDLPRVIQDGVLIVLKGRVAAIGKDLPIPPGMAILDYRDHVIMPGLVLADTHWVRAVGGFESISAKYHSLDGFDFYANQAPVLAGGVTTAYLNPGRNRLVSGLGAVIKVAGEGPGGTLLQLGSR